MPKKLPFETKITVNLGALNTDALITLKMMFDAESYQTKFPVNHKLMIELRNMRDTVAQYIAEHR